MEGAVFTPVRFPDVKGSPAHNERPGGQEHLLNYHLIGGVRVLEDPVVNAVSTVAKRMCEINPFRSDKAIE